MKYGIFLYKTTAVSRDALYIDMINRAVSKNSNFDWEKNSADNGMLNFGANAVKEKILSTLTIDGNSLCKVEVRHSPQHKVEYLYVVTSYEKAKAVLNAVHAIAVDEELVLYDCETDRTFYTTDLYCKSFVTMRMRAQQLNNAIMQTQKPIWHLRRLDLFNAKHTHTCSYVVTIEKDSSSFEERTSKFYEMLKSNVLTTESLSTSCKCFTVCGEGYEITYCLEGYKKCADKIGYVEDARICTELMRRMPSEVAAKQFKNFEEWERIDICDRMKFSEWINCYPNPADRFVASINLAKQLRQEKFDITLGAIGSYGAEVIFHVTEDRWTIDDPQQISVLKVPEEWASYILPIVETVYPYIDQRYYLTCNHLPGEMIFDILENMKKLKVMLVNDTYNETIIALSEKFDLYALAKVDKKNSGEYYDQEAIDKMQKNRMEFIFDHRYDIARLYDVFIYWAEKQLECYEHSSDLMINIQGP